MAFDSKTDRALAQLKMIDDDVVASVLETLQAARLFRYDCDGPQDSPTARLEARFAEIMGVRYALAMNSCSSALFTSLLCTGIQPGSEVLIPAFTFIAVPSAVVHAGGRPVLVEVTPDYYVDIDALEASVTPKTTHLLLSYMRGRVPDMDAVVAFCQRHGLSLVEDSAHSLGVEFDGRKTGTFGRAGAFSAQSYKLIDGGEGGLLITDEKEIAHKAMLYAGCYERNYRKHHGVDADAASLEALVNTVPAYNFRMSNLSAAVLLPQIERIEERAARGNANYAAFAAVLETCEFVRVPKFHPKVRPAADSTQFEILRRTPEQLADVQRRCVASGLPLQVFGLLDNKNARCFWNWTFFAANAAPRTRALIERTADMRLPLSLTPERAAAMAKTVVEHIVAAG